MPTSEKVRHLGAAELLSAVVDPGSFVSWDAPAEQPPVSEGYAADLARARDRSGTDESVLTGAGLIQGRRVAVIVSEFAFLAGSIGHAAAQRIVAAVERATAEGLPLLAGPASGGTRMQEGTLAFLSMVKITGAVRAHRQAGLPYLVYLRHPTTGGVMASWGSLGHINVAEPGALLGFLGPRVYEALYGEAFPDNVQTAENLFSKGLIDGVVAPGQLANLVARALDILAAAPGTGVGPEGSGPLPNRLRRKPLPSGRQLSTPGPPSVSPGNRGGRTSASSLSTAPAMRCPSTVPARGKRIPGCSWRWPGSAASPALCWATPGRCGRTPPAWAQARCGRPGGA